MARLASGRAFVAMAEGFYGLVLGVMTGLAAGTVSASRPDSR